jgi:hypothetical protein
MPESSSSSSVVPNSITLTGCSNPENDDRILLYIDVIYDGELYKWKTHCPADTSFGIHISNSAESIYADIAAKIDVWGSDEEEPPKESIVKPDDEDYYIKRKKEYPPVQDQLDALWKGMNELITSLDVQVSGCVDIHDKIQAIKDKYPKS